MKKPGKIVPLPVFTAGMCMAACIGVSLVSGARFGGPEKPAAEPARTVPDRTTATAGITRLVDPVNTNPYNIVFIMVDDLGWKDLGCTGSTYFETPHIDALAAQGMIFRNAYAACAVCSPTRAAVMTGRYPARIGITDWIHARFQGAKMPRAGKPRPAYESSPKRKLQTPTRPYWMEHEEVTIAETLKPAGYTSCHIGKWHLGMDDWYPCTQGFDYNYGGCDYGHPPGYFDPYTGDTRSGIPHLPSRKKGEYLTDRERDEAVAFIRGNTNTPFYLNYNPYAVHVPLQAKTNLVAYYRGKPNTSKQTNARYAAMIHSVDEAVGAILAELDRQGIADRTIVFFTSDNGGLTGATNNSPLREGKGYPYEGGIRVPFIVRWPGVVKAGTACETPVSSIDILPTLCEATGISQPVSREIDGTSIVPLLKGREIPERPLFWHFPHYRGKEVGPYSIVRQGDWKLIKWLEGPSYELYNLKKDPGETNHKATDMPGKIRKLDTLLNEWYVHVKAKQPKINPGYIPPEKTAKTSVSK
jgi:arylsulfatase A-like enzyme